MVNILLVAGAIIALICLGFSAVIFGAPFTILVCIVIAGVAFLAYTLYRFLS